MAMNATGSKPFTPQLNVGKTRSGYTPVSQQQFTPEQMQLLQQGYERVNPNSYLSKLAAGDEDLFNQLEAPAMRQFQGLQGNIASRFSGMGSGARRSSGFQNTINQASSDFASDLQAQRMGLQRNAIMDLHSMSNDLLGQRPYEQFLLPKQKSGWQQFLEGLGGGVSQGVGSAGAIWGANKLGLFNNSQSSPQMAQQGKKAWSIF
jgi:hypothetical protein